MHRCVSGCTLQAYCCNKATCIDAPRRMLATPMAGAVLGDLCSSRRRQRAKQRLYLCRHGQTDWNAAKKIQGSVDRELNELGERQALLIGEALKSVDINARRLITIEQGVPHGGPRDVNSLPSVEGVRIHPGLREMNFGELEGAVAAESSLDAEVNAAWASGDVERKWPAGESPRDVELRGRQALAGLGLLGQKDGPLHAHVAVVCHGRFNKILLSSLLGGASTSAARSSRATAAPLMWWMSTFRRPSTR